MGITLSLPYRQICEVLGESELDEAADFAEMGLDSIMLIDQRSRLANVVRSVKHADNQVSGIFVQGTTADYPLISTVDQAIMRGAWKRGNLRSGGVGPFRVEGALLNALHMGLASSRASAFRCDSS